MRRIVTVLALSAVLLVPAGAATADDWVEIDERLASEGFDAWTDYLEADDGVRISVDLVSDSADSAAFDAEAEAVAEVVWSHLEMRVQAVDVLTTSSVSWLEEGLPAAVSLSRTDLQERFGPRPAGLDDGEPWPVDDAALAAAVAGGAGLVLLAVGAACGFLLGFLLGRRRRGPVQQAWGSGPWDAPGAPQQGWPQQQPVGTWGYTPTAPNPPST
jgi:hypothetical protein